VGEQDLYLEEYTFDTFSSLLKTNPEHILIILNEIKKVHEEILLVIDHESITEATLSSLIHKVKGGAQLLSAKQFIQSCESLEKGRNFATKLASFKMLLEEQNQIIERYQTKYS
jgi:two-component system sensor histidine kinase EvgS